MVPELLNGFYLHDVFVEPTLGRVKRGAESIHLPPKAMEVLLCLARRPGDVVSRKRLLESVWGSGQGSPVALNHAIGEIRRALGDHYDHPTYVQTLPRRGYRLLVSPQPASLGQDSIVLGADGGAHLEHMGVVENLRQRGVLETALAYLILGWLLIQIADIVFEQLLLPRWAGTFVTVLVIAGFPIAIALSWFIEIRGGNAVLDDLTPSERRRKRFGNTYLCVLGGLAIAAGMVYIYDRSIGLPEEQVPDLATAQAPLLPVADNSIAVLPFLPLDETEESRVLANGIAEDIISMLSRVPGLLVAARGDAFTLAPGATSKEVRTRLRVAMYVEGSIHYDNDMLRIVVQLIDSETGFQVLSRKFDKPLQDYFDVREEVTSLVVSSLRPALPPGTRDLPLGTTADPDFDVYFMYRRGVEASRGPDPEARFDEALSWFEKALAVDPGYAAAHAGICEVSVDAYLWSKEPEHIDEAKSACSRALALNPNLDIVYTSLGDLYAATGQLADAEEAYRSALEIDDGNSTAMIGLGSVYQQTNRLAEAEQSLRKAVGLNPGNWPPYNELGRFLFRSGRYAEAAEQFRIMVSMNDDNALAYKNLGTALSLDGDLEQAEPALRRALELEPNSSAYDTLGLLLYSRGKYSEAATMFEKAIGLRPRYHLLHSHLADALQAAGRTDAARTAYLEARDLAADALRINPRDAFVKMDLAWISAALGDFARADTLIRGALNSAPDDPFTHYISALISSRQGTKEQAFASLERAVDLGYTTALLEHDPILADLQGDPRWQSLVRDGH